MQLDVSPHDVTWLKVKNELEAQRTVLLRQTISKTATDRDRSDWCAQVRLIDEILRAPAVFADRVAKGAT